MGRFQAVIYGLHDVGHHLVAHHRVGFRLLEPGRERGGVLFTAVDDDLEVRHQLWRSPRHSRASPSSDWAPRRQAGCRAGDPQGDILGDYRTPTLAGMADRRGVTRSAISRPDVISARRSSLLGLLCGSSSRASNLRCLARRCAARTLPSYGAPRLTGLVPIRRRLRER